MTTVAPGVYGPLDCGCVLMLFEWDPCGPLLSTIMPRELADALRGGASLNEPIPDLPDPSCPRYAAKEHTTTDFGLS